MGLFHVSESMSLVNIEAKSYMILALSRYEFSLRVWSLVLAGSGT